jgi:aspartyl protease
MKRSAHLVWLVVAGCSIGAPPAFPSGDSWTVPLVGPLENGALVAPVMVDGHGPYLFAVDPDALVSAVDDEVVHDLQPWRGQGPRRIDETYTTRPRFYAELLRVKIGSLAIDRITAMVFSAGTYDIDGRHISGVIGRDVLAESLVFGFDRDQGLATLSTVQAFAPPAGAIAIRYEQSRGGTSTQLRAIQTREFGPGLVGWTPRRLATAQIGGQRFTMHLDLGSEVSQLDESKWARAGLVPAAVHLHLTDEAGLARDVTHAGIATSVRVGSATGTELTFAPYIDERFPFQRIDGALGLDFFRRYSVFAKWDNHTYYLRPRGDFAATTTARLGRWGAALPACPHPGCVTAEVIAGDAGPVLHVVRDPQAAHRPLEVSLALDGERATTVPLVVSLPAIADQVTRPISPSYLGATLVVADVSPFPRRCPTPDGCVRQLGRVAPSGPPGAPDDLDVPAGLLGLATPRP